jgi:hypothetical protein
MKTLHLRILYRKHATIIDCLLSIAIGIFSIIGIILCIIHGDNIDAFYPNRF